MRGFAMLSAATLLLALLGILQLLDPLPEGLVATYFLNTDWSSAPVLKTIDSRPSGDSIVKDARGTPPLVFSATWAGWFITLRDGTYTFATTSEYGSWVYVDGQTVVTSPAGHGLQLATGSTRLARGVHPILVKYIHNGSALDLDLSWSREGSPLQPMPAWEFFPRHREFRRLFASAIVRHSWRAAAVVWLATVVFAGAAAAWRSLQRLTDFARADPLHVSLACLIGCSVVLNAVGIWWGVPSTWAGDELTPKTVVAALEQHFSNGWFNRYPPAQFYVLSGVFSPWLLLKSIGWLHVSDRTEFSTLLVLSRSVSVVAGAGTLVAVYLCGERAFGKRAGVLAAGLTALIAPFVYYSKTANPEAPYVFWFAVSLVFYVRLLGAFTVKDAVAFAAAGALAICTKDQAYALYLLAPVVVVYCLWRSNRDGDVRRPFRSAMLDARLVLAALTAAALFLAIHDVPFNFAGFLSHVRDLTGPGSQGYRIVEPTLAGRWSLLRLSIGLDEHSLGWPLCVTSIIGIAVALTQATTRRAAIALVLMAVSYYVGFIEVILYNYDRYLLPICIVQTLFAGVALDRLLRPTDGGTAWWRMAVFTGALAYTFLYAATVDVLMVRDSRYATERWLRTEVGPDRLIARMFGDVVLPRLDGLESEEVLNIDELEGKTPAYFVLNADYARSIPVAGAPGQLIAGLQHQTLGYRLVFRYRAPDPWPWLPAGNPDLVGSRLETPVFSTLRSINPTMEIYQRQPR